MINCPNGKNPIIEWQYLGEEKQRILGADDYSTKIKRPDECPGWGHQFYYHTADVNIAACSLRGWRETQKRTAWPGFRDAPFTNFRVFADNTLIAFYPDAYWDDRIIASHWSWWKSRDIYCGQAPHNQGAQYTVRCDTAKAKNVLILGAIAAEGIEIWGFGVNPDYPAATVCSDSCQFKVFKHGQTVYQRTTKICPEVTYSCEEKCPPGTCECSNGSTVCCYDTTTGKCIKSFTR